MSDRSDSTNDSPPGASQGYEPRVASVNGYRTRYFDVGEGDPLVLLHGGNWGDITNANTWVPIFDRLSDHFRVLAFDRVGCGWTEGPDDLEDFRYRTELDHALGFLDTLEIDGCHLCGMSRGAGLGAAMNVDQPDRFRTFILSNSGTLGPPAGDKQHRKELLVGLLEKDPLDPGYIRQWIGQYCHQTDHLTDEFCQRMADLRDHPEAARVAELMVNGGYERYAGSLKEHMAETRRGIETGRLTIPTLYVFGINDISVPQQVGLSAFHLMAQENPDVRMKIVNRCGHFPYREHPEEFAATVTDFIDHWE